MFQASLSKASILKKILESIRELVIDANIEVSQDGMFLQAMDASHVSLVNLCLRANQFNEYACTESMILGINIVNLTKILKCAENDDKVTIRHDSGVAKLTFVFEGKQDDKLSEFHLNLISLDSEQLGIPEQEYTAVINMRSDEFARVCRELSQISDTLAVEVTKESVKFSVGGDLGEGIITLKHRETGKNPTCITASDEVKCSYAMRYLNLFNKASVLSEEICISISDSLPLIACFDFELGSIKFYLAPKVNDD